MVDAGTYVSLVKACACANDVESATRWLAAMHQSPFGKDPSEMLNAYTHLLKESAKSGDDEQVKLWLAKMQDEGVAAEMETFCKVLKVCGRDCYSEDRSVGRAAYD